MTSTLLIVVGMILAINILETFSQICFKTAIKKIHSRRDTLSATFSMIWRSLLMARVWVGLYFALFALLLWINLLSKYDLNFAYSLSSIEYIFVALASQFILKEKLHAIRWVATLLIVIGVCIVGLTGG